MRRRSLQQRKSVVYVTQADINQAFIKVGIGAEKKSRVISEKEKKITAYHEAGHAILFHLLPDVGPVHTDLDHSDRTWCGRLYNAVAGEG